MPRNLRKLAAGQPCKRVECTCAECGKTYWKRADRIRTPDYCGMSCRMSANQKTRNDRIRQCAVCGTSFIPRPAQLRDGGGKYCSIVCNGAASVRRLISPENLAKARNGYIRSNAAERMRQKIGPKNPSWRGGRYQSNGYFWIREPGSGRAKSEHRRIMERHLGRTLGPNEVVHHINHDKTDNRIENLVVLTRAEHIKEHLDDIQKAFKAVVKPRPQKLSSDKVIEIRRRSAAGESRASIARDFDVTPTMVSYIVRRKNWSHIS